jgi:hypothetical protein
MLSSISIPPFALRLDEEIRIILSRVVGFSNARGAVDPDSSDGIVGVGRGRIQSVSVDGLLYRSVFLNRDESLLACFSCAHVGDLGVAAGDVSFLIAASGS